MKKPKTPAARYSESGAAAFQLLRELDRSALFAGRVLPRGRLALLRALATGGPQTMSDIARARSTSRQAVQRLAGALLREGLLTSAPNPKHRRAPLLTLSEAGAAAYQALASREATRLNQIARDLPAEDLRAATRTLKQLRTRATQRG